MRASGEAVPSVAAELGESRATIYRLFVNESALVVGGYRAVGSCR
jgi:hypothetical protein